LPFKALETLAVLAWQAAAMSLMVIVVRVAIVALFQP
jgi:hypothetical protein